MLWEFFYTLLKKMLNGLAHVEKLLYLCAEMAQ